MWCATHAGAVTWVRGLKERLHEPMDKLSSMDRSVTDLPAFRAALDKYDAVMAEMDQYEAALVADWCSQVRVLRVLSECWSWIGLCCERIPAAR